MICSNDPESFKQSNIRLCSRIFFNSRLFEQVQMAGIFSDSKTFADAIPKRPIDEIIAIYEQLLLTNQTIDLLAFVQQYFDLPETNELLVNDKSGNIDEYIQQVWLTLTKSGDREINSSLLALKKPYVVPGGRFREVYYWDSYFTALGLLESNQVDLVNAMLDNFVELQSCYGCIPNGNRSYYLSRSQPPILGLLVELLLPYQTNMHAFLQRYVGAISAEYHYWMQGKSALTESNFAVQRVIRMPNGSLLNRYWDDSAVPRPESYREDKELLAAAKPENSAEFYRNIRAACESGWDFSSRWLAEPALLSSIRTTNIIPIDLNCLLFKMESLLGDYFAILQDDEQSRLFIQAANERQSAINRYLWHKEQQIFTDYVLEMRESHFGQISTIKSLASVLPLFVGLASDEQAQSTANALENEFLAAGGLVTTLVSSEQQWDAPNGWAPLQWFAVKGLQRYHFKSLANEISERWLATVDNYFERTGKLMEKYNVCQQEDTASGGEYDVQEGFGWTNGVYQVLKAQSALR